MATVRLTPSTYYLSSSSYLSVSNENNMYDNVDSTNYATVTNTRTSTTSYYIYIRGFNFSDIPSNAVVSSFTIKCKCNYSGGYAQAMYLYDGTSTSMGSSDSISSTVTTHTFTCNYDWDDVVAAGSDFGIRINCRRSSRNTTAYIYVYGAEIEVTYTIPNPRTVTTTLSGNGTIDPSGTQTMYDGDDYTLVIVPTNSSDTVTAKRNGTDITSQLVHYSAGSHSEEAVLGEYELISGSFNGSGASYFQGIVGNGYNASTTTSNYYSGGSATRAVFQYATPFFIPNGATITRLYMKASGHAESTSNSNEYMCVQLKSGDTEFTEQFNFKSAGTSNTVQTIEADVLPTAAQLENLVVECTLGYYGGAINGVTVYVEYTSSEYYEYTEVISGDLTIAVVIGGSGEEPTMYVKLNGSWVECSAVYIKQNGSWVLQSDITQIFDTSTKYVKGN